MQKLITKYGLAAHLSLVAVAPLFLFPFCNEVAISIVMLWLSAMAWIWLLMEPSVLEGETFREARSRVVGGMLRDPLFWVVAAIVVMSGVRALNGGIALLYDAEAAKWYRSAACMPLMPSGCGNQGFFLFAGTVSLWTLLQGVRYAMGKSARGCFLLLASALAGLSAVVVLFAYSCGYPQAVAIVRGSAYGRAFASIAYGVYFMVGTVALVFAFERRWNRAILLLAFSIGGTGAGLWAFSDSASVAVFAVADLPIMLYSFFYTHRVLRSAGEFKCLVVFGVCLTVAVVLVMGVLPISAISSRMAPIVSGDLLSEKFIELRRTLGRLSLEMWKANPWLGTGLGSFSIDLRLAATDENWLLIPSGQGQALNGWWQLLVERGIVGSLMVVLPLALLFVSYGCALYRSIVAKRLLLHPVCLAGPLALAAVVALTFVDSTVFRPELTLIVVAFLAVSANSFSKERTNG